MEIHSPAFHDGEPIPAKYTCEGEDVSPPLQFVHIPPGTLSLALVVDDPDAPMGTFDHWIVWNLPVKEKLAEGESAANQGKNHFNRLDYGGPCPPPGKPHRYFFKVYALDAKISLKNGATKGDLEAAMQGHILSQATLIGTYKR